MGYSGFPNSGAADALVGFIDFDTDGATTETASHMSFCPAARRFRSRIDRLEGLPHAAVRGGSFPALRAVER